MAILINDILQGIGAEVITVEESDKINIEPGIHIVEGSRTIMNYTHNKWAVYSSYDQENKVARSQLWIPLPSDSDTVDYFFIRSKGDYGSWGNYRKFSSGDKLITLKDAATNIFSLVDNTDVLNPKIRQDDTKADKVTGNFTPNSLAAIDANGNLITTERQLDWIDYYTIEFNDAYAVELQFCKQYDDSKPTDAEYKGYGYATISSAEVNYTIRDREKNIISPDQVKFKNWRGITLGNNSLKFVKYTTTTGEIVGVSQNAVIFNGVKEYIENESAAYMGSAFVDLELQFTVGGIQYVETRTLKVIAIYGKRNVWLEQGTGSNKFRLDATYVDPTNGVNPQFYNSETVDAMVSRITIPGNHENQIMVFGNPAVAGDIYRWLDVADSILEENKRTNTRIPTEKAIASYVDNQVQGKGVSAFDYGQANHKLTLTKSDKSSLSTEIPVASTTVDGLMTKEDKQTIASLAADVSMLSGKARIVGNLGKNPTSQQVQAYWESVKGTGMSPEDMVGSIVLNLDQDAPVGHSWMYVQYADGSYGWMDKGQDSVSIATNNQLGTVKGVEAGVGYNYHCNFINQLGNGLPYLTKTLTNTVDPTFTIKITKVDGAGNILEYDLNPKTGNTSKFLSRVEFTNSAIGTDIFRFDITSFATGQGEGYASVNTNGELLVNGYKTLREQVEYQLDNKVDKQGINIRSTDGFITITGESPNFAIGLNIAGSRQMIDLTNIIDGVTKQWDLATLPVGEDIKGEVTFWYGDGRLIPGKDYMFNIDTDPSSPTYGSKNLVCLNEPAWDPSENRTLFVEVTKTSLISDITGISDASSGDGSIIYQKQGNTMELRVNDTQIFRNTPEAINTPTESTEVISNGTIMEYIQSLSNNVRYLLDNAVWKNSNTDKPLKIAFQSTAVTPEAGVNKIQIDPNDLGQL